MIPDRARIRRILELALPIVGGMVSQNVLNLVDAAMVGSFGDAAVSAVGLGGFANFLATAFITGMSAGVQAMAARRCGEGKMDETAIPLNGGLLLACAVAIPWSVLLFFLVPHVYWVLNADPAVQAVGVPFLQWRLVGAVALGMNFAFRGFWNGVGQSGMYLQTLLVMHASNILLGYVLIFGAFGIPGMGPVGSGLGTTIATFLGVATYVILGWRQLRPAGFLARLPTGSELRRMLETSVPAGVGQAFFAGGLVALSIVVGRIGTKELAAHQAVMNVLLTAYLPGLAFGLAAGALVGQALGRKDPADARRWGWHVATVAFVVGAVSGLILGIRPDIVLAPFLSDPATRALGATPLRVASVFLGLEAATLVLSNALLGAGDSRTVLRVGVLMQWVIALPYAAIAGPYLGGGLLAVWLGQVGQRLVTGYLLARRWEDDAWTKIKV